MEEGDLRALEESLSGLSDINHSTIIDLKMITLTCVKSHTIRNILITSVPLYEYRGRPPEGSSGDLFWGETYRPRKRSSKLSNFVSSRKTVRTCFLNDITQDFRQCSCEVEYWSSSRGTMGLYNLRKSLHKKPRHELDIALEDHLRMELL